MLELNKVHEGDALELLKKLGDESVQCVVTSPPYWGLRDYGVEGQLGLEPTPEAYVNDLVSIFQEIKRVLKKDGTVWLNLGDTYYSKGGASRHKGYSDPKYPNGRNGEFNEPQTTPHEFLKPKDLVGIPWRVAFALQERLGFYLRQAIIWHKPNAMPSSVTDRPSTDYEFVFLLSKSEKYYYDADAIREPHTSSEKEISRQRKEAGDYDKPYAQSKKSSGGVGYNPLGRNCRAVWSINTKPNPEAHFAVFPEALPERCIKAGTKEQDVVLDPFAGSGTTLWVAKRLNRQYVGLELSPEYCKMANKLLSQNTLFEVIKDGSR